MGAKGSVEEKAGDTKVLEAEAKNGKVLQPLSLESTDRVNGNLDDGKKSQGERGALAQSPTSPSQPPTPSPSNPPRLDVLQLESKDPPPPVSMPGLQVADPLVTDLHKYFDKVVEWTPNVSAPEFRPGGFDTICMDYEETVVDQQQMLLMQQQHTSDMYDINYSEYGVMGYDGNDTFATDYSSNAQWLMAAYDAAENAMSQPQQWNNSYAAPYGLESEVAMTVPSPPAGALTLATAPPTARNGAPTTVDVAIAPAPQQPEDQQKARETLLKLCGAWKALGTEEGAPAPIDRNMLLMYQAAVPRRRKPAELRTLRAGHV
mmetsp:Transcript_56886/g.133673  ORF Transcript_56886/g.133673 Transcript_56886/m.133673 type:complete len:318 (-) Transcript_56886:174-1127(-)